MFLLYFLTVDVVFLADQMFDQMMCMISSTAASNHCLYLPCLARMVASYLVHHSYCATAEAFAKSTNQAVHEELASIKNRQSE